MDTAERLPFHFSLSCIGEGNGNPLQCSCLENPRDGGAWWAAIYRVAQSRTQLKRLRSSSSKYICVCAQSLSHIRLFVTPWTVAHQTPLSTGFPRQEYRSELAFPTPGGLPDSGIKPESLASPILAGRFFTTWETSGSLTI